MSRERFVLILTTVSTLREGRELANLLLKRKLAACINISQPFESWFRWKGKTEKTREYLLLIKTRSSLYAKVERTLRDSHSYDVPEILALPISYGSDSYLSWLLSETHSTKMEGKPS